MLIFHYDFALIALLVCLILTGIHTYLGYHVVRRGVIFVDLSLAQVAALGASVGILLGWGHEFPVQNYCISLTFTLLGALLFVLFRTKREKVPIEALIGITYAGAIALSLIVLERSATGTEEIKNACRFNPDSESDGTGFHRFALFCYRLYTLDRKKTANYGYRKPCRSPQQKT